MFCLAEDTTAPILERRDPWPVFQEKVLGILAFPGIP